MAISLAKIVFKKIGGKILAIRPKILAKRATPEINVMVERTILFKKRLEIFGKGYWASRGRSLSYSTIADFPKPRGNAPVTWGGLQRKAFRRELTKSVKRTHNQGVSEAFGRTITQDIQEAHSGVRLKSVIDKVKIPKRVREGRGVDFDVLASSKANMVLKIPRENKFVRGLGHRRVRSEKLKKLIPGIDDPVGRSMALQANLPNFGIPTAETYSIRLLRNKRGLLQPFSKAAGNSHEHRRLYELTKRDADKLSNETGLALDAHLGNVTSKGELRDTALGRLPTHRDILSKKYMVDKFPYDYTDPKEVLGGHWGTKPTDHIKRTDVISDMALKEGQSPKILRRLKALKARGWRLQQAGEPDEFKLHSPQQRIARAETKGIRFVRIRGRIVPIRPKKGAQ